MARRETGDNQETDNESSGVDGIENIPKVQAADNSIAIGGISAGGDLSGEVNIAGRDIIKNINTIYERALTTAEEAAQARKLESELLARGVAALVQSLSAQASEGTQSDTPYKGLLPYSLNEAEIFYGRYEAKRELLNGLRQGPLTVLHAESGAGKTSLLQAGIAARLIANGHLAIYLRSHDADPVDFIKRMFLPELAQAPALAAASLHEFLRQVCAVLGPKTSLYLSLDQFEEFFNLLKKGERQPFLKALADCLNDPSLKVRWVLALRAEALSDLAELEAFGITPFKNIYRLNRLSRLEAREAIVEPARRYGITFEPALIEHILDTLTTNDEVMPTHLQLVCSALTNDLPVDKTLTLAHYTEEEGGTEGILRDYLKRQLEHLPNEERALAWKVLRTLITADRQRTVKTHEEIVNELKTSGVSKKQIDTILKRLVERRLLFTPPAAVETFELAHDYLINEIELDPQEQARKAAQELLDQETRTYQRYRTLLSTEQLAQIEPYQSELGFSAEAKNLFIQSKRRRSRNRILISTIAAVVLISMTILTISSIRQARISRAGELAAQSVVLREKSFQVSLLLSIEAFRTFDTPRTRGNLLDAARTYPQVLQFLAGHAGPVLSVAFSPDGTMLASGSYDGTIVLWDVATHKKNGEPLQGDAGFIRSIAFSPDGGKLASGSDRGIILWDVATRQQIGPPLQGKIYSVAFSPDGDKLASGNDEGTVILWDVETRQQIGEPLQGHTDAVPSVAFSPDGEMLASGGLNGIVLWDVAAHQQIGEPLQGFFTATLSVAFSPDGRRLASGRADGNISLWDVAAHEQIGAPLQGHTDYVQSVAFSPDGATLASGSRDGTIMLRDVATHIQIGELLQGHTGAVLSVAFSRDGSRLASGGVDHSIILWDVNPRLQLGTLLPGHTSSVQSVTFNPDGTMLASTSDDGTTILWDVATHQPIGEPLPEQVLSMAFSPDSTMLASGRTDGSITLWDVATRVQIGGPLQGEIGNVNSMAFSRDVSKLASGNREGTITLWDVATRQQIGEPLQGHTDSVQSLAFSPDGATLASGSHDGTIILWDVETHQPIGAPLQGHDSFVWTVAFSRDGTKLASGDYGGTTILWDVETHQPIGAPLRHDSIAASVAFSPDGTMLASGSNDGTIILLDIETHQPIGAPLRGQYLYPVFSVAFNPDGTKLASGSVDHSIMLWDLDTRSWLETACYRAGRNFSRGEWALYFLKENYRQPCEQWPLEPEATPIPSPTQ